jgi:adenylyl cyclase-associated protein
VAAAPAKGAAPKGPPKTQLDGNKWSIENHVNNNDIVVDQTEIKHVVYIYNCHNSTIKICGKVNAITIGMPLSD